MTLMESQPAKRVTGFTLVELIATMVVITILAAVALPNFVGRSAFDARAFNDQAQSVVRYAQKIAIAERRSLPTAPIYVVVTADQIRVCYDANCNTAVSDAGGPIQTPTTPSGITLSPVTTFSFDGSGTSSAAVTINVNGADASESHAFSVEPTGYVHS